MSKGDQNDHVREHDHLVEPMYGGLELAPEPRRRPPIWPLVTGALIGTALLLLWRFVFRV